MATAQFGTLVRHIQGLAIGGGAQHHTDRQLLDDFAARHTETAFTALVSRHGPMVLRVCRRVLNHEQDAEDAFQATFLVLAGNAGSIRKRDTIGDWLHGVAYRTAMKAKRSAARRRNHEAQLRTAAPRARPSPTWDDVQAVLDEEIQRLPTCFRQAFVLCVLEGKSGPEAAAELGCKEGTVKSRVNRGRQALQRQLARRGIHLAALFAALSLTENAGRASLPASLFSVTIRSGLLVAAGEPAAGVIPTHVAAMAAGVTRAMFLTKAKIATALLVAVALLVAGTGLLTRQALATPPEGAKQPADAKPPATAKPSPAEEKDGFVNVQGHVLDPDGKPVTGARLVFLYASAEKLPEKVWATSAADGGFQFAVARSIENASWYGNAWDSTYVVAAAEGHGFGWAHVRPETSGDLTLRLVKDDVPIQGRVIDLQGKPVAGVTVRIDNDLFVPAKGNLGDWLQALASNPRDPASLREPDFTPLSSAAFATLFPPVTSGPDGRFQINGIGRERIAALRVDGPTIATQRLKAMTRPAATTRLAPRGAPFDLLALATRPVVGVVRDKDSGAPLAGVIVRSYVFGGADDYNGTVRTVTDKEGRYRLVGLPKGEGNEIIAQAYGRTPRVDDLPYLEAIRKVADAPGLEPVTVDIALKRGLWVKGRVLDKATGKTVRAGFDYFCFGDNPCAEDLPLLNGTPAYWTQTDGSFRVVALPGRGLIAMRATTDKYLMAVGADQIKGRLGNPQFLDTRPSYLHPGNAHTIAEIAPKAGDESITCDVYLDPGRTLQGTTLGPDGKPLAGARVNGLRPMSYWENEPLSSAEFTMWGLGPNETRTLQMIHEEKKLAGWLEVRGDEKKPVQLRLEAWGVLTGRLVKPDGEPMTNVVVHAGSRGTRPDKDGKFRIDGLAPGLKYGLGVTREPYVLKVSGKGIEELTVRPGEIRDLGDVEVKPMD
jgi:RNA polymerase sigma factor (sigma-70 family)